MNPCLIGLAAMEIPKVQKHAAMCPKCDNWFSSLTPIINTFCPACRELKQLTSGVLFCNREQEGYDKMCDCV